MSVPDGIDLGRRADESGIRVGVIVKRALLLALAAVPLLALVDAFGQRPSTATATAGAGSVEVYAPSRVRAGLLYTARFTVTAHRELRQATLELGPGWAEGMQINTVLPDPVGQASHDGRLRLELGHVPAGERHVLYLAFQVDPTNVGRRAQDVRLLDGETPIAELHRTITLFP